MSINENIFISEDLDSEDDLIAITVKAFDKEFTAYYPEYFDSIDFIVIDPDGEVRVASAGAAPQFDTLLDSWYLGDEDIVIGYTDPGLPLSSYVTRLRDNIFVEAACPDDYE